MRIFNFSWGTKVGRDLTEMGNFRNFGRKPNTLLRLLPWNFWYIKSTITCKSYASTFFKVCQFVQCPTFKFLIVTGTYLQWFLYRFTSMGTQKRKYTFIYRDTLYHMLRLFLSNLKKNCFQVRKHTLSIVNYSKTKKTV